jgi:hypothetical protein
MSLSPRPEDAAARRARHRDTVISAVIAALVVIALAAQGVRGLRLSVAALLVGSAGLAILSARRADWDWRLGARLFLIYAVTTGILYLGARAFGLE